MIGTFNEAKSLKTATHVEGYYARVNMDRLPGWRELGSGMYRQAYLSPKGVVYKIERGGQSNVQEAKRYKAIKPVHESLPFRFAECTYWSTVGILAMEYVQDDGSEVSESFDAMRTYLDKRFRYSDCFPDKRGQNWHGVNGVAVITDYAYGWGGNPDLGEA